MRIPVSNETFYLIRLKTPQRPRIKTRAFPGIICYGQMQLTKLRFWLLALLLCVYLLGVLFLSAIALHETRARAIYNSKITSDGHGISSSSSSHFRPSSGGYSWNSGLYPQNRPAKSRDQQIVYHSRNTNRIIQWCGDLRFIDPPMVEPVALASFPGSGNTWLRYLLQQATGLVTGSVYMDYGLLKNGFPGESVTNGSVLVVKTHEWGPRARGLFKRAILLVRNPASAIQAEFNRQSGGHVGFASTDRYTRNKGKVWLSFVNDKLSSWKKTNLDWLEKFPGPTHVIFYEQLVDNTEHTLRTVLDFLSAGARTNASTHQHSNDHVATNPQIQMKRLQCALDRKEGIYRRKKKLLTLDPFTDQMRTKMASAQREVYTTIFKMATPVT